jgi:hypothetical protein
VNWWPRDRIDSQALPWGDVTSEGNGRPARYRQRQARQWRQLNASIQVLRRRAREVAGGWARIVWLDEESPERPKGVAGGEVTKRHMTQALSGALTTQPNEKPRPDLGADRGSTLGIGRALGRFTLRA